MFFLNSVQTTKVGILRIPGCFGFLVVSEVPELYRTLREACRKKFHQVLSKAESVVPTILKDKENTWNSKEEIDR